jgi:hypothetical protein
MKPNRAIIILSMLLAVGLFSTAALAAQSMMGSPNNMMGPLGTSNGPSSSGANADGNYGWMQNPAMWQMGSYGASGTPNWARNSAMWQIMTSSSGTYAMPTWMTDQAQWQSATGGQFGAWADRDGDGVNDMIQSASTWMNMTRGGYGGWMDKNGDDVYDGFQYFMVGGPSAGK